jgi:hypothetical protein
MLFGGECAELAQPPGREQRLKEASWLEELADPSQPNRSVRSGHVWPRGRSRDAAFRCSLEPADVGRRRAKTEHPGTATRAVLSVEPPQRE